MKNDEQYSFRMRALCEGFSKLNWSERIARLRKIGCITAEDVLVLENSNALDRSLAENFIENAIGSYQLPLGVAVNFVIDGRAFIIPMAIEETSIIAAASKTAKWVRDNGSLVTENINHLALGQIQIPRVRDFDKLGQVIEVNKSALMDKANTQVASGIVVRGGGVRDIHVRKIERGDGSSMAVIHILIDTRDAMGANIINKICEYLKPHVEVLSGEVAGMCILSNLADSKITKAKIIIKNIDPGLGEAISEASLFAQLDPYRAATNNKGVLNGMDAVLVATGNDWRAVEAGVHADASISGNYHSITRWHMMNGDLHGELAAPIVVGIFGGVTRLHPTAKLCLKLLGVETSAELARIVAAVGLVQNLGALKALVTVGIVQGHMRLHLSNLALASGATKEELPLLRNKLKSHLDEKKHVSGSDANDLLARIRKKRNET